MKKVFLALGFVVSCIAAHGQGSLDLSFGTVGYVRTNFPVNAPTTYVSSAIQADGKIVTIGTVDGDFAIARYNTDGTLDNSFSGDGMTTVSFGSSNDRGSDVAIAPDGKIVVVGTLGPAIGMARLNPDGSLDHSLSGNIFGFPGKAITPIGFFGGFAVAVSLQADGKIVAGGWEVGPFVRGVGLIEHMVVVRYNADGSSDTGFGVNGIRTIIFTQLDRAADMVLQPDGKIVIAGTAGQQNPFGEVNIIVSRLNPDGSADPAFNGGGVTTHINTDVAGAIALQPDGKLIVAGRAGAYALLLRYNPDGTLDNSFSGDGKLIVDIGVVPGLFSAVTLQHDGKIIVGGGADNFVLMRFNPDGTPDNSFSEDGMVTTDFENGIDVLEDLQIWNNRVYAVGRTTVNDINAGLVAAYLLNDVCQLAATIPDAMTLNNGVQPNTVYIGYQPASDLTLSVDVTGANGALSYLWSNGATTPTITVTPTVPATYTVTVTDASGCSATASELVNVVDVRCGNKLDKVMICKVPPGNPANASTNCISASAVPAHLNNGSYLGNCNVTNRIVSSAENIEERPAALALRALPNPSRSFFILDISSSNREKAELTVRDIAGRQVEKRIVMPGNKLQLGSAYRAGVYLVELRQGNERVILKLIKLGD